VYFKIGHEEEAKDLTSIIFLKTWNHIQNKTLENAKTLRALLYKIARTSIIDYYRENGGKSSTSLDDENNHLEIVDDSVDLEADLDKKANISLIKSKLPLLKDEYREVIILRFINDLTLEEIADISGKKKGNVRVLLHRALNSLREIIDSEPESTIKN
jgi:RNA polymerase sigma-70 factor (ECF subfamily)